MRLRKRTGSRCARSNWEATRTRVARPPFEGRAALVRQGSGLGLDVPLSDHDDLVGRGLDDDGLLGHDFVGHGLDGHDVSGGPGDRCLGGLAGDLCLELVAGLV